MSPDSMSSVQELSLRAGPGMLPRDILSLPLISLLCHQSIITSDEIDLLEAKVKSDNDPTDFADEDSPTD